MIHNYQLTTAGMEFLIHELRRLHKDGDRLEFRNFCAWAEDAESFATERGGMIEIPTFWSVSGRPEEIRFPPSMFTATEVE